MAYTFISVQGDNGTVDCDAGYTQKKTKSFYKQHQPVKKKKAKLEFVFR